MKKTVVNLVLLDNKQLNKDNYLLKLLSPVELFGIMPGQFVNVEIKEASEIFLRRPFSVLDVDYENRTISLLIKVLGRGSRKLTQMEPGKQISVVFPLGKPFSLPAQTDRVLLVGGGSGVAPMLFLSKISKIDAQNITLIIGAKTSIDLIDVSEYEQFANIMFTTEDGSKGHKGYVTDHPVFTDELEKYSKIYACGPNLMMKAIGKKAIEKSIFCEVSLENTMACGFGVCLCCVEDTISGHKCVCTDGPVFNVNELKW